MTSKSMSHWTQDDDAALRKMRDRGDTFDVIAGRLHRTNAACRTRAERIGIAKRNMTWTSDKDALLEKMRRREISYPRCAEALGCTVKAVKARSKKLGFVGMNNKNNRKSRSLKIHVAGNGAPPPAPRDAGLDRAIARIDRLMSAGICRSSAVLQVQQEMPHVVLREVAA